jgi:hypothetical protein
VLILPSISRQFIIYYIIYIYNVINDIFGSEERNKKYCNGQCPTQLPAKFSNLVGGSYILPFPDFVSSPPILLNSP